MKNLLIAATLLTLSGTSLANNKVIYGTDDREESYLISSQYKKDAAQSVAVIIADSKLTRESTNTKIIDRTLKDKGICKRERFAEQSAAGHCSAFLVAPNIIATAGHCIDKGMCPDAKFVFDYALTNEKQTIISSVPNSNVYSCKKVIDFYENHRGADWALVELDRKVTNRKPLKLSTANFARAEYLYTVGSPNGLPLKTTRGQAVSFYSTYFHTNLDTFAGNSGSPVIKQSTNEVVGILVRGETDYIKKGRCLVPNNLSYQDGEESVTYIDYAVKALARYTK